MVIFSDYDGTLSPIVDEPDKAFILEGMRPVLEKVHERSLITSSAKFRHNFAGFTCVVCARSGSRLFGLGLLL